MAIERGEWPPHGSGGNTMCDLQECRRSVYRNPDTGEVSSIEPPQVSVDWRGWIVCYCIA